MKFIFTIEALIVALVIAWQADIKINTLNAQVTELEKEIDSIEFKNIKIEQLNDSIFLEAARFYNIEEPEIVTAQSILETGWYKSNVLKTHNNPFGIRTKSGKYQKFNHWTDAFEAYKNYIEYKKRDDEDYYVFLKRIGYAEDSTYVYKVKYIAKKILI